jgi:hypothetical protein
VCGAAFLHRLRVEQRLRGLSRRDFVGDRVGVTLVRIARFADYARELDALSLLHDVRGLVRGEPHVGLVIEPDAITDRVCVAAELRARAGRRATNRSFRAADVMTSERRLDRIAMWQLCMRVLDTLARNDLRVRAGCASLPLLLDLVSARRAWRRRTTTPASAARRALLLHARPADIRALFLVERRRFFAHDIGRRDAAQVERHASARGFRARRCCRRLRLRPHRRGRELRHVRTFGDRERVLQLGTCRKMRQVRSSTSQTANCRTAISPSLPASSIGCRTS